MNVLSITGIKAAAAAKVVKGLNQLLADFQVYYTNLRGYHWHVRGPQFFTLHEQFEKMYDGAAEHIVQLGAMPENRFSEYLKICKIKEQTKVSSKDDIIPLILNALKVLIAQERAVAALADEAGDIATGDLVSDLIDEQEKTVWMIASLEA